MYLLRRATESRFDGVSLLSHTEYYYDDHEGLWAAPEKGQLTRKRVLYDNEGGVAHFADTEYRYDRLGRLTRVILPDGERRDVAYYGTSPYIHYKENGLGHRSYYRDYHPLTGKVGTTCGPEYDDGSAEFDKCDAILFDLYGRPTVLSSTATEYHGVDPSDTDDAAVPQISFRTGTITEHIYYLDDAWALDNGNVIPPFVVVISEDGPNRQDQYAITFFDGSGRVILEEAKWYEDKAAFQSAYTRNYFEYDALGRLTRAYRPVSGPFVYTYHPDAKGDHWRYSYDALDRLTSVVNPDSSSVRLDYLADNVVHHTDEEGNEAWIARNRYDDIISKARMADGEKLVSQYVYDGAGRLVLSYDEVGAMTSYFYYHDGVRKRVSSPVAAQSWERTPGGKITHERRGGGNEVQYEYDAIGRIKHRTVLSASPTDGCGPPTCDVDDTGQCVLVKQETSQYDEGTTNIGRLTRVVSRGARSYEQQFAYDAQGNVFYRSHTDTGTEDNRILAYEKRYNVFGDLIEARYGEDIANTTPSVSLYYDSLGLVSRIDSGRNGSALSADIVYYDDGQIENIVGLLEGPTTFWQFERWFDYDDSGRLTVIGSEIPMGSWYSTFDFLDNGVVWNHTNTIETEESFERDWVYRYDHAGRLISAQDHAPRLSRQETPQSIAYTYHDNGAIDTVVDEHGTSRYLYDNKVQKLLSVVVDDAEPNRQDTTYYRYDKESGARCATSLETVIDTDMSSRGSIGPVASYYWNADGTLHSLTAGGNKTSFEYDHSGARWYADRADAEDDTWYLDEMEIRDVPQADSEWHGPTYNVGLPGGVICTLTTKNGNLLKCSFSDGLNHMASWDRDGKLLNISEYAPYGTRYPVSGSDTIGVRRFTYNQGKELEPEYGDPLIYFGARYYDTAARQFISPDPLRMKEVKDTINGKNLLQPYVYAANDPITNFDPNGAEALTRPSLMSRLWRSIIKSQSVQRAITSIFGLPEEAILPKIDPPAIERKLPSQSQVGPSGGSHQPQVRKGRVSRHIGRSKRVRAARHAQRIGRTGGFIRGAGGLLRGLAKGGIHGLIIDEVLGGGIEKITEINSEHEKCVRDFLETEDARIKQEYEKLLNQEKAERLNQETAERLNKKSTNSVSNYSGAPAYVPLWGGAP